MQYTGSLQVVEDSTDGRRSWICPRMPVMLYTRVDVKSAALTLTYRVFGLAASDSVQRPNCDLLFGSYYSATWDGDWVVDFTPT